MNYDIAKQLMMTGLIDGKPASQDQLKQARDIVYAKRDGDIMAANSALPPTQPPFGQPPEFPNSHSQANNVIPGVFMSDGYMMMLNYDVYVYQTNAYNQLDYRNYADEYRSWRTQIVEQSVATTPLPVPVPYKRPLTLAQFAKWWASNRQNSAHPPYTLVLPQKLSTFDFQAYIADRTQAATANPDEPALGTELAQG